MTVRAWLHSLFMSAVQFDDCESLAVFMSAVQFDDCESLAVFMTAVQFDDCESLATQFVHDLSSV